MMLLTPEKNESHLSKTNSYIWQKEYGDYDDIHKIKVRNLCHYAGKYRGIAYSVCSLK